MLALTKLAREYGKGTMLIKEIAQSENIPQRFLEGILLDLKNIGILGSKLGKSGGYYLRKPPAEINMAEIIRHFEGAIALVPCASEKYYEACEHCKDEENCTLRDVFKDIREQTYSKLKNTTFAHLIGQDNN